MNIKPAIQTKGCPLRRDQILLTKLRYEERWNQLKGTGRRWIAEELKRVLCEDLLSKKFEAQKVETGLKVMLYNKFIGL